MKMNDHMNGTDSHNNYSKWGKFQIFKYSIRVQTQTRGLFIGASVFENEDIPFDI